MVYRRDMTMSHWNWTCQIIYYILYITLTKRFIKIKNRIIICDCGKAYPSGVHSLISLQCAPVAVVVVQVLGFLGLGCWREKSVWLRRGGVGDRRAHQKKWKIYELQYAHTLQSAQGGGYGSWLMKTRSVVYTSYYIYIYTHTHTLV
jgi:hypothetical protein